MADLSKRAWKRLLHDIRHSIFSVLIQAGRDGDETISDDLVRHRLREEVGLGFTDEDYSAACAGVPQIGMRPLSVQPVEVKGVLVWPALTPAPLREVPS
jgi:hypothetical protein